MKNTITPYLFGESTIRHVSIDEQPWFVIDDVCNTLEHSNSRMVKTRLHPDDVSTAYVIDSMGRQQSVNVCNESGLYTLIFQSRKAIAREFTRWVTSEVLPAIRRSGSYTPSHQAYLGLLREQIALGVSPDVAARGAMKLAPIVRHLPIRFAGEVDEDKEIQDVLDLMQPDTAYTIADLVAALPAGHRLRKGTTPAQRSTVGNVLKRARCAGRVQKLEGRMMKYQLPKVVSFRSNP